MRAGQHLFRLQWIACSGIWIIGLGSIAPLNAADSSIPCIIKSIRTKTQLATARGTRGLDSTSYEIFDRVYYNPDAPLSTADLSHLHSQGLESQFNQYRQSAKWIKKLNRAGAIYWRSQPGNVHRRPTLNRIAGFWRKLLPDFLNRPKARATKIFEKAAKNKPISSSDIDFLKKWNLLEDLERFQNDLKIHGKSYYYLSKIRQAGYYLSFGFTASTAALVGVPTILAHQVNRKTISIQDSLNEDHPDGMSRYDDKVELIFFTPSHQSSAIRVGGTYFEFTENLENLPKLEGLIGTLQRGVLVKVMEDGRLASNEHTRVELKLSSDERRELRRYLSEHSGRVFAAMPGFNDWVSLANRSISEGAGIDVPPMIDRSQTMTIGYYRIRKFLDPTFREKVGEIRFAEKPNKNTKEKVRDRTLDALEPLVFLRLAKELVIIGPSIDQNEKLLMDPTSKNRQ